MDPALELGVIGLLSATNPRAAVDHRLFRRLDPPKALKRSNREQGYCHFARLGSPKGRGRKLEQKQYGVQCRSENAHQRGSAHHAVPADAPRWWGVLESCQRLDESNSAGKDKR